jgi:hypothetical protein
LKNKPRFKYEGGDYEDITLLMAALFIIACSAILSEGDGDVLVATIPFTAVSFTLPQACWFKFVTGLPCPGCGLTHSFVAMARLDLLTAFESNPSGIPLFLLLVLQIPYRGCKILFQQRFPGMLRHLGRAGIVLLSLSVFMMILLWIVSMTQGTGFFPAQFTDGLDGA